MSKKKSYMDRKNILNEGIITYALEKLFKVFVEQPTLKNSKKVSVFLKMNWMLIAIGFLLCFIWFCICFTITSFIFIP